MTVDAILALILALGLLCSWRGRGGVNSTVKRSGSVFREDTAITVGTVTVVRRCVCQRDCIDAGNRTVTPPVLPKQ